MGEILLDQNMIVDLINLWRGNRTLHYPAPFLAATSILLLRIATIIQLLIFFNDLKKQVQKSNLALRLWYANKS